MLDKGFKEKVLLVMDVIAKSLEFGSGCFCVLLFAGMTAVTLLGILFRYVMSSPFEWTEELARFLLLSICFLALNMAMKRKEHIAIPGLVERLPRLAAKGIGYAVDAQIALFLVLLIKQGTLMADRTLMSASTLPISMKWVYLFVPLGALLTLIQLVIQVVKKSLKPSGGDGSEV
ncbi:MAG: TRAP transporter small permease [Desulfobacteraceae bacterium]